MLQSLVSEFEAKNGRCVDTRRFCNFLIQGGDEKELLRKKIRLHQRQLAKINQDIQNAQQNLTRSLQPVREASAQAQAQDRKLEAINTRHEHLMNANVGDGIGLVEGPMDIVHVGNRSALANEKFTQLYAQHDQVRQEGDQLNQHLVDTHPRVKKKDNRTKTLARQKQDLTRTLTRLQNRLELLEAEDSGDMIEIDSD
jgi:predicted  nucleic acid-binding Zn-ribbon protein